MHSETFHGLKIKVSEKDPSSEKRFFFYLAEKSELQGILTKESISWSIVTYISFFNLLERN